MARLGVNIDHVATVRQARRVTYPDPLEAARAAEAGGADGITVHLREDRRHIQDADVVALRAGIRTRLNLEIAATPEMVAFALQVHPDEVCLVPERRAEVTTEGGLDVAGMESELRPLVAALRTGGIGVSLFVDPDEAQITASDRVGADAVELHTGRYCDVHDPAAIAAALAMVVRAAALGGTLGLVVNAGHGLRYDNVRPIAALPEIDVLNIGHSIVARALVVGMEQAVAEMRALLGAP
jgi:pyridoxine 5-phosphate synthase